MPHDHSNILELVLYRDKRLKGEAEAAPDAEPPRGPADEARAIISCLEYLYGETIKLDQRMSAHLIGAAAESLRHEFEIERPPQGDAS